MPKTMHKPINLHPSQRYAAVDALRGVAMVWMTVFHFCFDLQHFGYIKADFYTDRLWTWQRVGIVSLFVFCAGLGQAIAVQQGQTWGRFWRRWRLIALSAVLVSLGSWWMFPQSYIYFGILHGMAVMLILARLLAGMGGMCGWLW
ncbi:MAG: heparan-alpha-glucosaminide N-acetyltransferase, partial [Rhodoferax sp.]|nr:heparan-alpha-glucosaminide N-acetyltransferase [Rhodoferax sp.]